MKRTTGSGWVAGLVAIWIGCAPGGTQAQTILLHETFDGDFPVYNGWTVGDTNAAGTPAYWDDVISGFGGEGAHGGNWKGYCAGTGLGGTFDNPTYVNSMAAEMRKSINLHGYSTATLSFWYKIPSIQAGVDKLEVFWGTERLWSRDFSQSQWTQVTLNLDRWAGYVTARDLRFVFTSDGSTVLEGAYLDDIMLTVGRPTADAYEPDNGASQAKKIYCNQLQARNIHAPGEVDWVKFTVGGAGARNLRLQTFNATTGQRYEMWDTMLGLYRGSGGLVAEDDDGGDELFSRIDVAALAPGTYFIKVTRIGELGVIPGYYLYASWVTVYNADAFEADDYASQAKSIANGATQNRSIHQPGNADWAKLVVPAAGARNVVVETAGASGDTELWLIRGNGTQVAYDDDSGAGDFSRISVAALTPGTYFIKVHEYFNDGTIPSYTLKARWTSP